MLDEVRYLLSVALSQCLMLTLTVAFGSVLTLTVATTSVASTQPLNLSLE